jgi:hypothetical protein
MTDLGRALCTLSRHNLKRVAQFWDVAVDYWFWNAGDQVAQQMATIYGARTCWEKLGPGARPVLRQLVEVGGSLPQSEFLRLEGADASLISFFGENMVVATDRKGQPRGAEPRVAVHPELMPFLRQMFQEVDRTPEDVLSRSILEILRAQSPEFIREMATLFGMQRMRQTPPDQWPQRLAEDLLAPGAIDYVLGAQMKPSQKLFEHVGAAGGRLPFSQARRELAQGPDRTFRSVAVPLTGTLLLIDTVAGGERLLLLHPEIAEATKRRAPELPPPVSLQVVPAPETAMPQRHGVLWNMLVFTSAVQRSRMEVTQQRSLHKRAAKKLSERFLPLMFDFENPADMYLDTLVHWKYLRTQPRLEARPSINEWTKLSFVRQAQKLLALWETGGQTLATGYKYYGPAPREFHDKVLDLLREMPVEQWVTFGSLAARLRGKHPFWLRSREEMVRVGGFSALQHLDDLWKQNEEQLLQMMLGGFLADLGLLRTAVATAKGEPVLTHLLLTEFGHTVLTAGKDKKAEPVEEPKPLVIQPNFEVLAMQPNGPVWYGLARFAEPLRYDRVATFHITQASVRGGAGLGLTGAEMVAFLREHALKDVPQNVAYEIEAWAGNVQRVRVRPAVIIEADSAESLGKLLKDKAITTRSGEAASSHAVLLPPQTDINRLLVALESAGMNAVVSEWE